MRRLYFVNIALEVSTNYHLSQHKLSLSLGLIACKPLTFSCQRRLASYISVLQDSLLITFSENLRATSNYRLRLAQGASP